MICARLRPSTSATRALPVWPVDTGRAACRSAADRLVSTGARNLDPPAMLAWSPPLDELVETESSARARLLDRHRDAQLCTSRDRAAEQMAASCSPDHEQDRGALGAGQLFGLSAIRRDPIFTLVPRAADPARPSRAAAICCRSSAPLIACRPARNADAVASTSPSSPPSAVSRGVDWSAIHHGRTPGMPHQHQARADDLLRERCDPWRLPQRQALDGRDWRNCP